MRRDLKRLAEEEYDVVIIGGGAFGCCAAWEAASRGLSVALVERGDFCEATSAKHLKMVHGGIRYLQHMDLYRVRESCRERSVLLRVAPHLVQPLPIVMPTYGHGMRGKGVLGLGLFIYDSVTFDRNRHVKDQRRCIPWGRTISRSECLELFPHVPKEGLTGAGVFYDAQFYNPPRLALAFLGSAVLEGAAIANYVQATGFLRESDRVSGVHVRDVLAGETFDIRGRMVLNAAGPWADQLLQGGLGQGLRPEPVFSRDVGLVLSNRVNGDYGLACQLETRDKDAVLSRKGRHVFVVPWRDHTLVGVWHSVHRRSPDELSVGEDELASYVNEINSAYPGLVRGVQDVSMVYSGLTLFGDEERNGEAFSFGKRSLLVDHAKTDQTEGLVTLIGVRATTARGVAKRAIELICRKSGKRAGGSRTAASPVQGGDMDDFEACARDAIETWKESIGAEVMRGLVHNYGTEYKTVLNHMEGKDSLGETVGDSKVLKAQIVHAVREEMALKLKDVLFRRTDLCAGGCPGQDAVRMCADVMGNELGWAEERIQTEVADAMKRFPLL